MSFPKLWQEIDCPNGADRDLDGDAMLFFGQEFDCPWCGEKHRADVDAPMETMLLRAEGAELEFLPSPPDAATLAVLRRRLESPS